MASISLCMIVKNEEAVLARCLDSLADIPDERIIVDTGSQDNTKAIAKRYTDLVFDFPWVNDFSAARNFSLSKASCDYIYVADADEVIDQENLARFRLLKQALLSEIEVVEMAYTNQLSFNTTYNFDTEYRPKLFRRMREFCFMDPVHEVLRTDPIVFRSDVAIQHCPQGDHSGRDISLLARYVKNGGKLTSRLEMMYARELLIAGTLESLCMAQPYFEGVLNNQQSEDASVRRAACVLSRLAMLQHDARMLLCVAAPELVGIPPSEICCAMGDYYLAENNPSLAANWYDAALSGAKPELVAAAAGKHPLEGLANCFEWLGDMEKVMHYRTVADAWQPESLLLD